jgi:Leucine-rich repeat (LRR) protein
MLHDLVNQGVPLERLPDLPKRLQSLHCYMTMLQQLPDLPESLRTLHCESNQLQLLPALPEGLQELNFVDNPLRLNDNEIAELHRTYQSPWEKLM